MSAAARRLHVSQSALSQTINSLEREVGVKLSVRSSSGVSPTAAGMTCWARRALSWPSYAEAVRTMAITLPKEAASSDSVSLLISLRRCFRGPCHDLRPTALLRASCPTHGYRRSTGRIAQ